VETTQPVELRIQWKFEKSGRSHYTYEDYFAFERWYRVEDGATGHPASSGIWQASVTVHKVERKEDGTVWVYYLAETPVLYQSDSVREERLMILREVDGRYRILSNLYAVDPLTGSLLRFL
jgi:hypothetical protein